MNVLKKIDNFLELGKDPFDLTSEDWDEFYKEEFLLFSEQDSAYQKFFKKKLKEWGVNSPADLSDADKKKFFAEVEKGWKGKSESTEISEKIWSAAVKTKWSPPPGLFTKGKTEIARVLAQQSDSLKQAMARLNFYINRAGKNLPPKQRKTLEMTKEVLRQMFAKKEKGEKV